jgi:3',5'-cyclic AMP phosphodiesterase CpdA
MRRRLFLFLSLLFLLAPGLGADEFKLPLKSNSVRFAAIGDMGTGNAAQYEVAQRMVEAHQGFPFDSVIMLGDNLYGGSGPSDFEKKFALPYKPLLDAGVKFYAALGNHDNPNERFYKLFNMNGATYYTFKKGNVHFFVLDSNYMDPKQLAWLETQLRDAGSGDWKICYFHHPLYSSGRTHGPATDLRLLLEPLFIKYGVDVVFAGHEHVYERIQPQKGIYYFTEGASGELRYGNLNKTAITSKGFDTDRTFMLVEIAGDEMYFQTISRAGQTVDSGVIQRTVRVKAAAAPAPAAANSRFVPRRMTRTSAGRRFLDTPPSVPQRAVLSRLALPA